MGDPTSSDVPVLGQDLSRLRARLSEIPPGKTGALVLAIEWRYGLPSWRMGVATRVGDEFAIGADVEKRFSERPNAKVYAALTW